MTKREKTKYPGVTQYHSPHPGTGKEDVAYYIRYRRSGKQVEERVGWKSGGWTPARAANERAARQTGSSQTNQERREAEEAARAAVENRWTFDKLWLHYLEHKTRFKGRRRDEAIYDKHLRPTFGNREPSELAQFDVQGFRVKLERSGLKPQSVKNILALLRRIALYGHKNALCLGLGFQVRMPERINNTVQEFLDAEDARRVWAAADAHRDRQGADLVKFALVTGLRASELFRLEWRDIDRNGRRLLVRDSKSGRDEWIPLNDYAVDILSKHPHVADCPYVFPGARMDKPRATVSVTAREIRDAAGLPKHIRPLHDLRHAFASLLASSGKVTLYELQKLLRHCDPRITERYAHLIDTALQRATGALTDVFKPDEPTKSRMIRLP